MYTKIQDIKFAGAKEIHKKMDGLLKLRDKQEAEMIAMQMKLNSLSHSLSETEKNIYEQERYITRINIAYREKK